MDNFTQPPKQPLPPDQIDPALPSLPPKHKAKSEQPVVDTNQLESNSDNNIESLSDDEFDALLAEQLPVIPEKPPQCDWHLSSMFSGNYPDPFSLPATHLAKHSLVHDVAAFVGAVIKAGKEAIAFDEKPKTEK